MNLENYNKAIGVLTKILKMYPDDKNYFDKLISCYNLSSKDDDALIFLKRDEFNRLKGKTVDQVRDFYLPFV